jgi:hypothetical protein
MWQIILHLLRFVEGSHLDKQCVGWIMLLAGRSPKQCGPLLFLIWQVPGLKPNPDMCVMTEVLCYSSVWASARMIGQ